MNLTVVDPVVLMGSLFPWAILAVTAWILPRVTRPDLFFAITVKPNFRATPEGAAILRRYSWFIVLTTLLAPWPVAAFKRGASGPWFALLAPTVIELGGMLAAFLAARSKAMRFQVEPSPQREAMLAPRTAAPPGNWIAQSGPFLILAVAAVVLCVQWDKMPSLVPIHWDAAGHANSFAAKSFLSVFGGLLIAGISCVLIAAVNLAVWRGGRRVYGGGQAGRREATFIRALFLFLLGMEYWVALLLSFLASLIAVPHANAPAGFIWVIPVAQTAVVVAIFWIAMRYGQGGWRGPTGEVELPADARPVGDRTPDACWKLGLIYYNPDDSALFVGKRFGVGWTLNMANPRAWIFMGGILLFTAVCLGVALTIGHGARLRGQ